jgi:hypothetical protein
VLCASQIWLGSRLRKHLFYVLFVLLPACLLTASPARSLEATKVLHSAKVLNDRQLDSVTAGAVSINLDLSASAEGPTAVTSTQGSIRNARTTVLLLGMNLAAPKSAQAQLIGMPTADLVFAIGKAGASGASDAGCSAVLSGVGNALYVAQSRTSTPISATCYCSAFAIGIVSR